MPDNLQNELQGCKLFMMCVFLLCVFIAAEQIKDLFFFFPFSFSFPRRGLGSLALCEASRLSRRADDSSVANRRLQQAFKMIGNFELRSTNSSAFRCTDKWV